jgi:hypothetical protein
MTYQPLQSEDATLKTAANAYAEMSDFEKLSLTGEVCEIGDLEPDVPGFRMKLSDGRVITVTGLSRAEVIGVGTYFHRSATISVRAAAEVTERGLTP